MGKIKLLHGSDHIIEKPDLLLGKTNNDYGRGFYCTQEYSIYSDDSQNLRFIQFYSYIE